MRIAVYVDKSHVNKYMIFIKKRSNSIKCIKLFLLSLYLSNERFILHSKLRFPTLKALSFLFLKPQQTSL